MMLLQDIVSLLPDFNTWTCAGRITHHEEVSRLKKVYELVKEARQQVEGANTAS